MSLHFPKTWRPRDTKTYCGLLMRRGGKAEIYPPSEMAEKGAEQPRVMWASSVPESDNQIDIIHRKTGLITPALTGQAFSMESDVMALIPITRNAQGEWVYTQYGMQITDEKMLDLALTLMQFAATDAPTHIFGESGVGKEGLAHLIHGSSSRRKGPLIFINCGALHRELGHGELFGREKGSYTGATHEAPGLIERAHKGTLFLDEVGELSLDDQARLLRVLETGTVRRLGAGRERKVDIRIVSATHVDLLAAVREGTFREDLYYRLCVLECVVPALRDRPGDLNFLAGHFLREFGHPGTLKERANTEIQNYSWPGNIRQLKNVMYRAAIVAGTGDVDSTHLNLPSSDVGREVNNDLQSHMDRHIRAELIRQRGNRRRTCAALNISRSTLYRWLRRQPSLIRSDEDLPVANSRSHSHEHSKRAVSF